MHPTRHSARDRLPLSLSGRNWAALSKGVRMVQWTPASTSQAHGDVEHQFLQFPTPPAPKVGTPATFDTRRPSLWLLLLAPSSRQRGQSQTSQSRLTSWSIGHRSIYCVHV